MTLEQLIALISGIVAVGLTAIRALEAYRARSQGPAPPVEEPLQPDAGSVAAHVHTYALTSSEKTGAHTVNVYRCAECGDIQRWQTN